MMVFFDCECANTKGGIGKICSLGYVICDDQFNVIEKDDVVMNPECEFDWYLFSKKGDISLAYSKEYFRQQETFPFFYERLKKIFTQGSPEVLGFAVGNDVGFVNSACARYKLPFIEFTAFDLAKLLSAHYGETKKLKEWVQFFNLDMSLFQAHKSEDDALMTLKCLKEFCARSGKTYAQLKNEHKDFLISSQQSLEQAREREYRKKLKGKIQSLYDRQNKKSEYTSVLNQHFEVSKELMKDLETSLKLVRKIYSNGGITHRHLQYGSGYVIYKDEITDSDLEILKKRNLQGITFKELMSILE
ncbi:MAG: hypothetical protein K5839_05330 [Treponemataceae bacterium]|nr:hypothetical protein [Treponemataceae bacterium]